jgi:phage-related protein
VEVFIAMMPVIMPIIEIILRINMLITQLVTGVIVSVITTIVDLISKSEGLKNIFDSVVNGIGKFLESIQKLLGWLMGNQDGGGGNKSWWNWAG